MKTIWDRSPSQLGQDRFVFETLGTAKGYFVEFGASDGVECSNTFILERLGWSGLLAEPARHWHHRLRQQRKARIDTRAVWRESGMTLPFRETEDATFSTIDSFAEHDDHDRSAGNLYDVQSVSLNDLLVENECPTFIDYLSIDTEGSEFDILDSFDFSRFTFGAITCEHNYTPRRDDILALLTRNGYRRVRRVKWDDWFIHETCLKDD